MTIATHAQALAGLDWWVFPVGGDDGKQPLVKWRDQSTTEPELLFDERPGATGIGVDCGPSGLVVLDLDDLDAFATWFAGIDAELPETLTAQTQSGGRHMYFTADTDRPIRNSASKLAPGVDVRGEGGYVVAPPSPGYVWTNNVPPVPVPEWLHDAVANLKKKDTPAPAPAAPAVPAPAGGPADRWGQRVLDAELARLATAADGTRNSTLFETAANVFEAVKGDHIDRGHAWAQLESIAQRIGLDPTEVRNTLESAWERTAPRHPKEELRGPATSPVSGGLVDRPTVPVPASTPGGMTVLTLDEISDLPPPRWLLNRRLPEGMTVIYGQPGSGKTFVALDWCMTFAAYTGERVLYLAGEGVSGFRDRTAAWRRAHANMDPSSFAMIPQVPQFMDPTSVAEFRQVVAAQKPALVVIDTLHRSMSGGDENSATDVGIVVRVLDALRAEHGTSSLILHHTSANGTRERGSTSLRGAADAMWKVTGDQLGGLTLSCDKLKDGEYPGECRHRFRTVGPSVVIHPPTSELVTDGARSAPEVL